MLPDSALEGAPVPPVSPQGMGPLGAAPRGMAPLSSPSEVAPRAATQPESINLKGTLPDSQVFGAPMTPPAPVSPIAPQPAVAPAAHSICKKCNYPLGHGMSSCPNCGTLVEGPASAPKPQEKPAEVKEGGSPKVELPTAKCQECGNELQAGAKFCPSCGKPVKLSTVNPWATPKPEKHCTLLPLAWEGEEAQFEPLTYTGKSILLNRENTESDNPTITSSEQAELVWENGEWFIVDKSVQKTTFIHVGEKRALKKGDVILMGNRRFEFND